MKLFNEEDINTNGERTTKEIEYARAMTQAHLHDVLNSHIPKSEKDAIFERVFQNYIENKIYDHELDLDVELLRYRIVKEVKEDIEQKKIDAKFRRNLNTTLSWGIMILIFVLVYITR